MSTYKHSAGYSTFLDNDIEHGLNAQALLEQDKS